MGKETYYICDNCGLKLLLGMTQPSCGHRNLILDKYCSRTEQIIHILISVIDYKETITCVAAKKRRSRNARAGIYNCHLKKCTGQCLEDLGMTELNEDEEAISYPCPRHDCEGIMHQDPKYGYILGD